MVTEIVETFNSLCSEYRALPDNAIEQRNALLEKLYPLANSMAAPIILHARARGGHREDLYRERFGDNALDLLLDILNRQDLNIENYTHYYVAGLRRNLCNLNSAAYRHLKHERTYTDAGVNDNILTQGHICLSLPVIEEELHPLCKLIMDTLAKRGPDKLFTFIDMMDGLNHKEMARKQRIPVGTVKSRINDVRQHLRGLTIAGSDGEKSLENVIQELDLPQKKVLANYLQSATAELKMRTLPQRGVAI
jgi:hypothetical protein